MITYAEFDTYCAALPATHKVVQWGGAHVWKLDTKIFAVGGWTDGEFPFVTFKVSPDGFDIMKEQPGLRPAPYLASRGMKWIQMMDTQSLTVDDLKMYLKESHRLVSLNLTKKKRVELGLDRL